MPSTTTMKASTLKFALPRVRHYYQPSSGLRSDIQDDSLHMCVEETYNTTASQEGGCSRQAQIGVEMN